MTHRTALQALAEATGSVNAQRDVHDTLAQLMTDCRDLLPAAGAGALVVSSPGTLDLLAASSHRAGELEMFQIQAEQGPCLDCVTTGAPLSARGEEEILARWGTVGEAIVGAGFDAVHALPISWNGTTLGGLNLFGTAPGSDQPDLVLAQAFADLIAILQVRRLELDTEQVHSRMCEVLQGRAVIEQAKGVLAYQRRLPLADAYDVLRRLARSEGRTLTATATALLEAAQRA